MTDILDTYHRAMDRAQALAVGHQVIIVKDPYTGSPVMDPKFAGVWTVKTVNKSTVSLTQDGQPPLRAAKELCVPSADMPEAAAAPVPEHYAPGVVVTSSHPKLAGLWTVLSCSAGKAKLAELGGGRLTKPVPVSLLARVPLNLLATRLPG